MVVPELFSPQGTLWAPIQKYKSTTLIYVNGIFWWKLAATLFSFSFHPLLRFCRSCHPIDDIFPRLLLCPVLPRHIKTRRTGRFQNPTFRGVTRHLPGGVFVSRPVYPSLAALRSWGLLRTLPATPPNRPRQNLEIGTGSGKCQNILWTTPLVKMLSTKFPQTSLPQTIAMLRPRAGIPINI